MPTAQTIATTKFYGPTDSRGSRVRVMARDARKFVPFNHAASTWHGIDEDAMRKILPAMLDGDRGDTYVIDSAKIISGPDEDIVYWLVTYSVTYADER